MPSSTPVRCRRSEFTEEQYRRYEHSFWPVPASLAPIAGPSLLAELWLEGRAGAISLLPLFGILANTEKAKNGWWLSLEEASRLAGVSPKTAGAGRDTLVNHGLIACARGQRLGKTALKWRIFKGIAATLDANGHLPSDSFRLSASVVYGGSWSLMTAPQRAVYVALAANARTFDEWVGSNKLIAHIDPGLPRDDLNKCFKWSRDQGPKGQGSPVLRLACVSVAELQQATGLSETAIHGAIKRFKDPAYWPDSTMSAGDVTFSPLAVYRQEAGGSLIYHFRDHADHYPWDTLNRIDGQQPTADPAARSKAQQAARTSSVIPSPIGRNVFDDSLPF